MTDRYDAVIIPVQHRGQIVQVRHFRENAKS